MKRLTVVPEHFIYKVDEGNVNKARGINLHSYTKNDCQTRCRSLLLFEKFIKESSPLYCRQIIDIQYFECRKFSFTMNRYSSWAFGRWSPLAIVAVSFETFKLFPINTAGTLHSRGSICRVNIGLERLYTTFTHI